MKDVSEKLEYDIKKKKITKYSSTNTNNLM